MESNLTRCLAPDRHGIERTWCPEIDVQLSERLVVSVGLGQIDVRGRDEHELTWRRRL
jgi:hypothetical protein